MATKETTGVRWRKQCGCERENWRHQPSTVFGGRPAHVFEAARPAPPRTRQRRGRVMPATHWWDRGGFAFDFWNGRRGGVAAAPLCKTFKANGQVLFSMKPTCRRCRFYRLAPTLGRADALARMAAEDALSTTTAPPT